ncbi:MAG: DUF3194 domain-containing protein, partial [Promethearchaeota archaeon]
MPAQSCRQNWKEEGHPLLEEMIMPARKIDISKLTPEQIEQLCLVGEAAASNYIRKKISKREIEQLDITIETTHNEELTIDIVVDLELSLFSQLDSDSLAQKAV